MKRILTACLTFLLFAVAAESQTKLKTVPVGWHTTLDPSTFASASIAYRLGDSASVFRGTGLRNSAQQIDTTQTLDLRGFTMPGSPGMTGAAGDTITFLRFSLYPI